MNKLWIRLTLAFFAVTLIGLVAVALLINNRVSTQFKDYVMRNDMVNSPTIAALEAFYAENLSWVGAESILENSASGMSGIGKGMGHGAGTQHGMSNFTLTDADGTVLFSRRADTPSQFSSTELTDAIPLKVDGATVGYLHFLPLGNNDLTASEQAFLQKVNLSILQAGVLAALLGLLLGIIIARGLSAPLQSLSAAANRIARGDLAQRVPQKGTQELADLAQSFNDMAESLSEAETLRQNLVADVAHELRTPLTVLQGNLRAILDGVYKLEQSEITRLYDQTRHLIRLVNDLRELAQAEAGQLNLNLSQVDLKVLAQDLIAQFEPMAQAENIDLNLKLPDTPVPMVRADASRLTQVFHNLLANAIRHTPADGTVLLKLDSSDDAVSLSVQDTGEGISAENLSHVFERFYRVDRARARATGGSGLGLAIARAIVDAHGGEITAVSEGIAGKGSRFTVRLKTP